MTRYILLIIFFSSWACVSAEIPYVVEYEGNINQECVDLIRSVSQLESLRKHPPATVAGLNRRIEADIPRLKQGLQTLACYKPEITYAIDDEQSPAVILIHIDPGHVYRFESLEILPFAGDGEFAIDDEDCPLNEIEEENLGIDPGQPAYPEHILYAETRVLEILAWKGYPLATIENREVVADEASKGISVKLYVDLGPAVVFGMTTIKGLAGVNPLFICRKICWYEGQPFNPWCIDQTQQAIEESGLFSSVTISTSSELDEFGELPVFIDLIESKHRTIALGVSYTTQLGPGALAEWELRNMRGLGERFNIVADVTGIRQRGAVMYRQPDFRIIGQDILWIGEFEHEKTTGFTETFYSITNLVEWQINPRTIIAYGLQFKELLSMNSDNNGPFSLLKAPIHLRWNTANNLLDPTRGQSINLKLTPTWSFLKENFIYYIQTLISTLYFPIDPAEKWILACKVDLGTIFGAKDQTIPPPERFYAGNEHTLRGYKYMTVSPLGPNGRPLGGRSLMVYSAELRCHLGEKIGWVAFYEVGNVYENIVPNFDHKQLQSVGFGLRYCTPVGPLRADVAVPLNRRRKPHDGGGERGWLDDSYEFYFSIGQAF